MLAMAALLFGFLKFPVALDRPPTAAEYERTLPPTPRLQINQPGDLQQFREREEQLLTTYGREQNSGAVRIPIDKAIDIIAGRGALPASSAKPAVAVAEPPMLVSSKEALTIPFGISTSHEVWFVIAVLIKGV